MLQRESTKVASTGWSEVEECTEMVPTKKKENKRKRKEIRKEEKGKREEKEMVGRGGGDGASQLFQGRGRGGRWWHPPGPVLREYPEGP